MVSNSRFNGLPKQYSRGKPLKRLKKRLRRRTRV